MRIAELTSEDVGRWVQYDAFGREPQKGRIKSWNSSWVFVVYACDGEWDRYQDFTGCATDPKDLEFINAEHITAQPTPTAED